MMIRSRVPLAAVFFWIGILSGCGYSPLLHHRDATSPSHEHVGSAPSDCQFVFTQAGLCVSLAWLQAPNNDQQAGSFILRFWSRKDGSGNGPYVDPPFAVGVQLWMPSMGHGSSPVSITRSQAGIYRVENVYFIMPGGWDIRVQLKQGLKVVEQAILKYKL